MFAFLIISLAMAAFQIISLADVRNKYRTNQQAFSLLCETDVLGFDIECDVCQNNTFEITGTKRKRFEKYGYMYRCPSCCTTRVPTLGSIFYGLFPVFVSCVL